MTVKDRYQEIADALVANPRFTELVGNRHYMYDYPESATQAPLFVLLYPMNPPAPVEGGSDQVMNYGFDIQINVEGIDRHDVKEVAAIVRDTMSGFNFAQLPTGLDEYFPETARFVDARRYQGNTKLYDTNY